MPQNGLLHRFAGHEFTWIGGAFVALLVIAYLVLHSMMTGTFDRLEAQEARGQAARIATTLGYEKTLSANIIDTEAEWDAMDTAVRADQTGSMSSLLPASQMAGFGLSAVIAVDDHGRVVSGGPIAAGGGRYLPVPPSLAAALSRRPVLLSPATKPGTTRCGVLSAGTTHDLFCSAPIAHTSGAGPVVGTLVGLKSLDAAGVHALGRRAGLSVSLGAPVTSGRTTELASALGTLRVQTRAADPHRIDLIVTASSVQGGSPLHLVVSFHRPIHRAALSSTTRIALIIGALGLLLLLVSILAQRTAMRRRNGAFRGAVAEAARAGTEVHAPSSDLAPLAASVNELLAEMARRREAAERERHDAAEAQAAAEARRAAEREADAEARAAAEARQAAERAALEEEAERGRRRAAADAEQARLEAAREARRRSAAAAQGALGEIEQSFAALARSSDTIDALADETVQAAGVARDRVAEAVDSSLALQRTTEAAADVTREISAVARRTRLLALNASIEAARAGEQGKGFAVVAADVGALADEAGVAAERVLGHMAQVGEHGASVVDAVQQTSETLATVDEVAHRIAQTVGEQRDAARASEDMLSGALERIAGAVEDTGLVPAEA
ncbi:MAG TPA: methyl-accepting chemotaxis protein [Solirubrobacteraceae bacterium]|nr:methyl-accepting chemotaxis protein [Solirubrobacteraceae bacterium]